MNASIVDLRYRMNEVLGALKRRERVSILYHGKVKGTIIPAGGETRGKVTEHPFFGMAAKDARSVEAVVSEMRAGRGNAL